MAAFEVGMKIYDNDWFLEHNLSHREAAHVLRDWGITFVLAHSRLLPMPASALEQEAPPGYDDRKFRDALADEGIAYWAAVAMFFDPAAVRDDPGLRSVGSDGRPMEMFDWYVGIPPSMEMHVERKTVAIAQAVARLEPDGVFLGFMRWPGFWEAWMPHHTRQSFPEYSFDHHTLERFTSETGIEPPSYHPVETARWVEANARDAWTDWKCGVVEDVIRQVRAAGRGIKPDLQIMLNTIPFGANEYDSARERVYGQRIETLAGVVDVFEVMAYHQILKRPPGWIARIGQEVKACSNRRTICTVQAAPLYCDGIHAAANRSPRLDADEFRQAVHAVVETSKIDGMVVFSWSDFLHQVLDQNDASRTDVVRAAAARRSSYH